MVPVNVPTVGSPLLSPIKSCPLDNTAVAVQDNLDATKTATYISESMPADHIILSVNGNVQWPATGTMKIGLGLPLNSGTDTKGVTLDIDDQDGNGPETLTFDPSKLLDKYAAGEYNVYVYRWGSGDFSGSERVTLSTSNGQQTVTPGRAPISGERYWNVAIATVSADGNISFTPVTPQPSYSTTIPDP